MVGKIPIDRAVYIAAASVIALTIGIVMLVRQPDQPTTNTSVNTTARETYATLSDALWQQDSGQGPILMTGTLLLPPLVEALGADTQRSEVEEQMWNLMKNTGADAVGVLLTFDSVSGFLSDDEIQNSLALTTVPVQTMTLDRWEPIIGGARPVNANIPVSSQRGVAIFKATEPVDWSTISQVTLLASGLGDQPVRQFVWTQISAYLE